MVLDKFLQKFVVKEKKFYPLYVKQSETIIEAAKLLIDLSMEIDKDKRISISKKIKEYETQGDKLTSLIFYDLYKTVVTPFDREDVHQLASTLDTMLDFIHDTGKKFAIYQPKGVDNNLVEIARYILEDSLCILNITNNLEKIRDKIDYLDKQCSRMKEIEHVVDDIYEEYMAQIFRDEKDPIELVKKKNIVQALEDTTDHAKDVAETVRTIIVKMS